MFATAALSLTWVAASPAATAATTASTTTATATTHSPRISYLMQSVIRVNSAQESVTLPLYPGRTATGARTWYIVTESSNQRDAALRGVNYAPKLANALGTKAVQRGRYDHGVLTFSGTVDFGPRHVLVPGPHGFPPKVSKAGAVGDAQYSPLVTTGHGVVLNASQVANTTGRSDTVRNLDLRRHQVTLGLLAGFVDGQRNFYLHTDASVQLLAGIEDSTLAPNLNAAPGIGSNAPRSARAAIIPVINGPNGVFNPRRQGLNSNLLGQGDPLNIEQEQPSDPVHYSPVWDVTPAVWTHAAIAAGHRTQLHGQAQVAAAAKAGWLVSGGTQRHNSSLGGLRAAGFISNCPVIEVLG